MSSQNKETLPESSVFRYKYDKLKDLTKYKCEPACLCRFDKPRSNFDQMVLQSVILRKPIYAPEPSNNFKRQWM